MMSLLNYMDCLDKLFAILRLKPWAMEEMIDE
jgi:hypothetical protein